MREYENAELNGPRNRRESRKVETVTIHVDFVEGGNIYWRNEGHQFMCECQHCEALRSRLETTGLSGEAERRSLGRDRSGGQV